MSAAEQLKPEEAKGERVACVLSSTSPKFPGDAEKVLKKAGYTVTRFVTLDELLNAPVLARPCIVVLEIDEEPDIQQGHIFLKTQENAINQGRLKAVLFTSIKHQDLRKRFKSGMVADFLIYPMPDRTFAFKLDLQAKILSNVLEAESKRQEVTFEHHSTQQKSGGRFNLKVVGPPPSRGGWHMVANTPQGTVRWRWIRKPAPTPEELAKETQNRDWQYEGKEPPRWDDAEKLWNMESEDPVIEKIEQGNKTFSSKAAAWLAREPGSVRKQTEEEIGVKRPTTKIFTKDEILPEKDLTAETGEQQKETPTVVTKNDSKNTQTTDLNEKVKNSGPTPQAKKQESESVSFSPESKSTIMDLRTEGLVSETPPESEDKANPIAKKERTKKIEVIVKNEPAEKAQVEEDEEPQDQAALLREKFREKQKDVAAKSEEKVSRLKADEIEQSDRRSGEKNPETVVNTPTKITKETVQKVTQRDYSQKSETATQKTEPQKSEPVEVVSKETAQSDENKYVAKSEWHDRRPDGGTFAPREIHDRREEAKKIEPNNPAGAKEEKITAHAEQKRQETVAVAAPATKRPEEKTVNTVEAKDAVEKQVKERQTRKEEKTTLPARGPETRTDEEKEILSDDIRKNANEDTLRARSETPIPEQEIRIRGSTPETTKNDHQNPLRVVKERVHYIKSLEELGDDNSTWERSEIYRVYIGAKKKYYGIESIQEALPIWVYIGESAPEYIEGLKSWKFFDNIPVKYTNTEDLPEPVLNLLLDLRKRQETRKLEEIRKRSGGDTEKPQVDLENQPLLPRGVQEREIKLKGVDAAPVKTEAPESRVTGVEHVRVETIADKVISLLIRLFRSGGPKG